MSAVEVYVRLTPSTFALIVGAGLAAPRRAPKRRRRRPSEATAGALQDLCERLTARFGRLS